MRRNSTILSSTPYPIITLRGKNLEKDKRSFYVLSKIRESKSSYSSVPSSPPTTITNTTTTTTITITPYRSYGY